MRVPQYLWFTGLALLALVAAGGGVFLMMRATQPAPIEIVVPSPTVPAPAATATVPVPFPSPTVLPERRVYISGAVRSPGVYTVRPDDRLADVLQKAGGATAEADLSTVNLAIRVRDEGHYHIPEKGETPVPTATVVAPTTTPLGNGTAGAPGGSQGPVDVNTATVEQLQTLPGIGPAKAQAIVTYREEHGPFRSVEDLMQVSGIGPATLEQIRPQVTVR